jgi:hypothetical protein
VESWVGRKGVGQAAMHRLLACAHEGVLQYQHRQKGDPNANMEDLTPRTPLLGREDYSVRYRGDVFTMRTMERDLDCSIMAQSYTLCEGSGKTTYTGFWQNEPRNNEVFTFWFWRMAKEVLRPKAWIRTEAAMNEIVSAIYDVLDPEKLRRQDDGWTVGVQGICQYNLIYYRRFCDSHKACKEAVVAWLVICKRSQVLH